MSIRKALLFLILAKAAIPAVAMVSGEPLELDLKSALERAPEANFQILLAQQGVVSQSEATRTARSALLPQVRLEATQARAMSPNVDPFSKAIPDIPNRFFVDRFDAVLRARLSILNTRSLDDWKISRLSLKATEWQLQDVTQDILEQIAVAYLNHWRSQRRMDVIEANLERDRILLQMASDQKEAGVATALDLTRAEVGLAGDELARLQQETAVLESALNLKQVLNLPLGQELRLATQPLFQDGRSFAYDTERFRQLLERRPDYQKLKTELERESLSLRAARRERLPSLELGGEWGYASESWSDDMEEQWSVQLGFSMPVFEGFRIDAQERLAASTLRQKEIELEELESRIEAAYRLVLQQLESSSKQVEVARRARDLNEREFDLERIRFEEGVADNSNVAIAQTNLADAEDTLVEAEFQYVLARISLARLEGDVMGLANGQP
jgi:outer membrane protein TolC